MKKDKVIKAYKGFNIDMTCNNFQYEEGKEYETDKAQVCKRGFHACEYPLDCLKYYNPARSVFHEVEQSGSLSRQRHNEDTKIASTKIKIGGSISIEGLVKAAIEYTINKNKKENYGPFTSTVDYGISTATGDYGASVATGVYGVSLATGVCGVSLATEYCGASSATGNYGASTTTGVCGVSVATGYCGASSATGNYGASTATGDYGASVATGNYGVSTATGASGASTATGNYGVSTAIEYYGASTATGNFGVSTATGDFGASLATGDFGVSTATGEGGASSVIGHCGVASVTGYCGMALAENKESIAIAWGYKSRAKGVLGSYLVFADWESKDGSSSYDHEKWVLKGAKLVQVDGKNVKADTWYIIENGEIIEAPEMN